jgi:hypothetical protein
MRPHSVRCMCPILRRTAPGSPPDSARALRTQSAVVRGQRQQRDDKPSSSPRLGVRRRPSLPADMAAARCERPLDFPALRCEARRSQPFIFRQVLFFLAPAAGASKNRGLTYRINDVSNFDLRRLLSRARSVAWRKQLPRHVRRHVLNPVWLVHEQQLQCATSCCDVGETAAHI